MHIHWSTTASGRVEIWHRLAGQKAFSKVADVRKLPTLQHSAAGTAGIYMLWGLYRGSYCAVPVHPGCTSTKGVQAPSVIYHDGFARADSFAHAAAIAFAPRTKAPAWPRDLGRRTIGGVTAAGGADHVDVTGPYTIDSPVIVSALKGYMRGAGYDSALRGVVYADDRGRPGALSGVTKETTIAAGARPAWATFAFASPLRLAPGKYWLGYWFGNTGALQYFDNVPRAERFAPAPYSSTGDPEPLWSSIGTSSGAYSLYAVYTKVSAGG